MSSIPHESPGAGVPQLLTVAQAAQRLGVSQTAVFADRGNKRYHLVPADAYVRFGARGVRVREDRLAAHVAACTVPTPVVSPLRLPRTAARR